MSATLLRGAPLLLLLRCTTANERTDGLTHALTPLLPFTAANEKMPAVMINTADLSSSQVQASLHIAAAMGINAVDFHMATSENGGHETDGVAKVIQALGRDALFLVTKLDKPPSDMTNKSHAARLAQKSIDDELKALDIHAVDVLLLKDSPVCEVMQGQWGVLEAAMAHGRARALGTYNFCEASLRCILETATTPPAYNFIMRHVGMGPDKTGLIAFGKEHDIDTVAYGTLGEPVALPQLLESKKLHAIAKAHHRPVEEVALKWNVQSGFPISTRITADYAPDNEPDGRSYCTDDCRASLTALRQLDDWTLTKEHMATLNGLVFDHYPQSPTYYSSSMCNASFGVSEHRTVSACSAAQLSPEGQASSLGSFPAYLKRWANQEANTHHHRWC
jgi:diketogulonate reductase-like aldo/keto reductase